MNHQKKLFINHKHSPDGGGPGGGMVGSCFGSGPVGG